MKKSIKFKTVKEFGKFLGLSDVEMELIKQKKFMIEKLIKARKAQGLSQSVLAKLCHTQQPAIARLESGLVSEVSLDFIAKVALILDVSLVVRRAAS
jgi:hypothetical protein